MIFSPTFVLGLVGLFAAEELIRPLPGPVRPALVALFLLVTPLPALLARTAARRARAAAILGPAHGRGYRSLERLATWSVPLLFAGMSATGALQDVADHLFPTSLAGRTAIVVGPLLLLEVGLRSVQCINLRWFELRGLIGPSGLAPTRLRTAILVAGALLGGAALADAITVSRELEVALTATTFGATLTLVAALAGLAVLLPAALIFVLPTDRRLPPDLAADIRATVERLGFPFRSVVRMESGGRLVTAALVGPLRWPRYLLLTDGILAVLDRIALRGVVAHEVGHARARHPMLLIAIFGLVPVLLLQPVERWLPTDLDDPGLLVGTAVAVLVIVWLLRALMHRFEFEADQLSAEALGGSAPTILALERVGELAGPHARRATFRHPSGRRREERLLRWDRDPEYRERFRRTGRRVRRVLAALLALAAIANVTAHVESWPGDRVAWLLLTGDFAGAARTLETSDTADAESLRPLVDVAVELAGAGAPGRWDTLAPDLAPRAWDRGLEMLSSDGPEAADPWLTLASLTSSRDPVRSSLLCAIGAFEDGDLGEVARVRDHLAALGHDAQHADAARRAHDALDAALRTRADPGAGAGEPGVSNG